jgi:hypothetical protein
MRPPRPIAKRPHYPDVDFDSDLVAFVYRYTVIGRWFMVLLIWLGLGIPALWFLRDDIHLWRQQFTWVAVWYGLHTHPWSSFALGLCLGMLLSTLVWQSRNILWGLPASELDRLRRYAQHLERQRTRSTLWLWFRITNPSAQDYQPPTTHHRKI